MQQIYQYLDNHLLNAFLYKWKKMGENHSNVKKKAFLIIGNGI